MYRAIVSSFANYRPWHVIAPANARRISSSPARPKKKKGTTNTNSKRPIKAFFAKHPSFAHNAKDPVWKEFKSLCKHYGWEYGDSKKDKAEREFKSALIAEFEAIYGKDPKSLESWKRLARSIGIHPIPDGIKECRKVCTIGPSHCGKTSARSYRLRYHCFPGGTQRTREHRRFARLQADRTESTGLSES